MHSFPELEIGVCEQPNRQEFELIANGRQPQPSKHISQSELSPRAVAFRLLFDRVLRDMQAYSDGLAELASTFSAFYTHDAHMHSVSDVYHEVASENTGQINNIAVALNIFRANVRCAIDERVEASDFYNAQLLVAVLSDIDKQLAAIEATIVANVFNI